MNLTESLALLRKHTTLTDLLQSLEAEKAREARLPANVVWLSQERAKRQQEARTSPKA